MAEGTKQHFGLTVLSSNTKEEGVTAKFSDDIPKKGGVPGDVVAKINGKIGNRAVFNSYEEENKAPTPKQSQFAVKAFDVYSEGFMSKKGGAGLIGDLGLDVLKLESKYIDLGLGPRCDTGINVGKEGVRMCVLGCGGEFVFAYKEKVKDQEGKEPSKENKDQEGKKPDKEKKDQDKEEEDEDEKPPTVVRSWRGIRGITAQWWWYKLKIKWG